MINSLESLPVDDLSKEYRILEVTLGTIDPREVDCAVHDCRRQNRGRIRIARKQVARRPPCCLLLVGAKELKSSEDVTASECRELTALVDFALLGELAILSEHSRAGDDERATRHHDRSDEQEDVPRRKPKAGGPPRERHRVLMVSDLTRGIVMKTSGELASSLGMESTAVPTIRQVPSSSILVWGQQPSRR